MVQLSTNLFGSVVCSWFLNEVIIKNYSIRQRWNQIVAVKLRFKICSR